MNVIIKKLFVAFLLFAAITSVSAQETKELPTIDLSITVSSLHRAITSGQGIPAVGTAVVLDGTIIERRVIDGEKETFSGELVMASGEWVSEEDVKISKCIILLNGPEYAETIPARRSRTVNPKEIAVNSELLVYAVYLGWTETDDGPVAVLQAGGVRKL